MTCFVDNVICATMRKTGVVVCSEALTKAIESRELLPSGSKFEVAFRAKGRCRIQLAVQRIYLYPRVVLGTSPCI